MPCMSSEHETTAPRYATRDEAVQVEITQLLELAGLDPSKFDIEAIAARVLDTVGDGTQYRWTCTADPNAFWDAVFEARHP